MLDASCQGEVGNSALARQLTWQALALSSDRDTRIIAVDALARAGDASGSQKLIDELAREFPTDALLHSVWLPVARATNQIKAGQAGPAVDTLEAAVPYEFGSPPVGASYWPMYVRGEAYLGLHKGAKPPPSTRRFSIAAASPRPVRSIPGPVAAGTCLRAPGGRGKSQSGLPGLLCGLERR